MIREDAPEVLVTEEASSWVADLSPERRLAIKRLHELQPSRNLVALVFAALWAGAAWAAIHFPVWPVRVPALLLIGASIHSLAILMHEGCHGNLFRVRQLDRWVGFLCGAPALLSCSAYRVTHQLHHRFNRTSRDPDEFMNLSRSRTVLSIAFYAWIFVGMAAYLVHVPVTALARGSRSQRVQVLTELGLMAALIAALFSTARRFGFLDGVLWAWVYPMGVAAVVGSFRAWAEHMMTRAGHPLTQTRTVTSNALVSFFLCNLNYHLEHHLFPAMPWYHLPRLHLLLQEDYRRAGSFVTRSYLGFVWGAMRRGVHVESPARMGMEVSQRPIPRVE